MPTMLLLRGPGAPPFLQAFPQCHPILLRLSPPPNPKLYSWALSRPFPCFIVRHVISVCHTMYILGFHGIWAPWGQKFSSFSSIISLALDQGVIHIRYLSICWMNEKSVPTFKKHWVQWHIEMGEHLQHINNCTEWGLRIHYFTYFISKHFILNKSNAGVSIKGRES